MESKILKQVEFYFSDANFLKDKFLQEESKKNEGWIPISTIASFSRMKQLSEDLDLVTKCLSEGNSEIFEVDSESKNIRRKSPIPENYDSSKLSLIASGFPEDATLDTILDFVSQHAHVTAVRMHRSKDQEKKFCGKATIVFQNEDEVKKILAITEDLLMSENRISFAAQEEKKHKQDIFVYGRLLKLEGLADEVLEIDVKAIMKKVVPEVRFVKRLPEGLYALFTEPIVESALEKFKDSPLNIGVTFSKVECQSEEKRLITIIQTKNGGRNTKRKRK